MSYSLVIELTKLLKIEESYFKANKTGLIVGLIKYQLLYKI